MLLIRTDQMLALEEAYLIDFVLHRIRRHDAELLDGQTPEQSRRTVARSIDQARHYRIVQPDDTFRYAILALRTGTRKPEAWISDLLLHPLLTGSEKMKQVEARLGRLCP